jgi:hypothetical protein
MIERGLFRLQQNRLYRLGQNLPQHPMFHGSVAKQAGK